MGLSILNPDQVGKRIRELNGNCLHKSFTLRTSRQRRMLRKPLYKFTWDGRLVLLELPKLQVIASNMIHRRLVLRLRQRLSKILRHVSISKQPSEWTIGFFRCDLLSTYVEQSPRRCGEVSTSSRLTPKTHSRLCLLRTLHVSRYEHVLTNIVDVDDTCRLGLDYIQFAKSPSSMHSNPSECSRKVASRIAPGSSRKRRLETAPSASWRGRSHHVHS